MQLKQGGFDSSKLDIAADLLVAADIAMNVSTSHGVVGLATSGPEYGPDPETAIATACGKLGEGELKYASGTGVDGRRATAMGPPATSAAACFRRPHDTLHGADAMPHPLAPQRVWSTISFVLSLKQKMVCVPTPQDGWPGGPGGSKQLPPGLHW